MKCNKTKDQNKFSNIFNLIRELEYENKSRLYSCRRIIRKLIVESDRKFRPIEFKMKYKHPIFCTSEIYCDYFKECITLQTNSQPIIRWKRKDNLGLNYSLKDYIFSEYPLNLQERSLSKNEFLPSLYALTKHNHLLRINLSNGIFLEDICLSKIYKFVRINYNTVEEKFCISTSISKIKEDKNICIAMFQLYPFSFKYMIEIKDKMFGANLTQASISNNCLLISKKQTVRIFNMFDVLSKKYSSTIEEELTLNDINKNGIKQTVFLKKLPPVLFVVDAPEGSLSIGGFPWHYITNSQNKRNAFNLYDIERNKLAIGCPLNYENNSIDEDMCYFHPDDSGVIMHLGSKSLKVLKIKSNNDDLHYLHEIFTISVQDENECQKSKRTKSGRLIKNRNDLNSLSDHSYKNIHSIIYDEDLNFLIVSILSDTIEGCAWIQIHDNTSGQLLITVNLEEYWNPEDEHSIDYDYDTLIHIVKNIHGKETIHIYRLQVTSNNLI